MIGSDRASNYYFPFFGVYLSPWVWPVLFVFVFIFVLFIFRFFLRPRLPDLRTTQKRDAPLLEFGVSFFSYRHLLGRVGALADW